MTLRNSRCNDEDRNKYLNADSDDDNCDDDDNNNNNNNNNMGSG